MSHRSSLRLRPIRRRRGAHAPNRNGAPGPRALPIGRRASIVVRNRSVSKRCVTWAPKMRRFDGRTPTANGRGAFGGSHVLDGAGNSRDSLAGLAAFSANADDWLRLAAGISAAGGIAGGCERTVRFWDWGRLVFLGADAGGLGRAGRDRKERALFVPESLCFHRDNCCDACVTDLETRAVKRSTRLGFDLGRGGFVWSRTL